MSEEKLDGDGHDHDGVVPQSTSSGDAALLLVESLIHHLVSRSIISVCEAIEIVDVASEVEREIALAAANGTSPPNPTSSLATLASSLRFELRE